MLPATSNPTNAAIDKLRRERADREAAIAQQDRHRERWAPVWEAMPEEERAPVREAAIAGNPFLERQHARHGDTGLLLLLIYDQLAEMEAAGNVPF